MYVLIFLGCFLPIAILNTALKMGAGVKLGVIPTGILGSIAVGVAIFLCKKYKKYKKSKKEKNKGDIIRTKLKKLDEEIERNQEKDEIDFHSFAQKQDEKDEKDGEEREEDFSEGKTKHGELLQSLMEEVEIKMREEEAEKEEKEKEKSIKNSKERFREIMQHEEFKNFFFHGINRELFGRLFDPNFGVNNPISGMENDYLCNAFYETLQYELEESLEISHKKHLYRTYFTEIDDVEYTLMEFFMPLAKGEARYIILSKEKETIRYFTVDKVGVRPEGACYDINEHYADSPSCTLINEVNGKVDMSDTVAITELLTKKNKRMGL